MHLFGLRVSEKILCLIFHYTREYSTDVKAVYCASKENGLSPCSLGGLWILDQWRSFERMRWRVCVSLMTVIDDKTIIIEPSFMQNMCYPDKKTCCCMMHISSCDQQSFNPSVVVMVLSRSRWQFHGLQPWTTEDAYDVTRSPCWDVLNFFFFQMFSLPGPVKVNEQNLYRELVILSAA